MIRSFDDIMGTIDLADYEIKENINKGAATNVFRATERSTQKEYAIIFSFHLKEDLSRYLDTLMRTKNINLPGIVKLYGYKIYNINEITDFQDYFREDYFYGDPKSYFFLVRVLDLMKNGNIQNIIKNNQIQIKNPTNLIKFIFGISSTMASLHKIHFLHRNLKPTKIFLDDNFEPRILLDIESVFMKENEFLNESNKLFCGRDTFFVPYLNTIFNAPEIYAKFDYSYSIDVYSFGIILYLLFSSKTPKRNCNSNRILLNRPLKISEDIWLLIENCICDIPDLRPSFEYIAESIKKEKIYVDENKNDINFLDFYEYKKIIELFK